MGIIVICGDEVCSEKMSGIPRYVKEIIEHLDKILDKSDDYRVCYPDNKKIRINQLSNMKLVPLKKGKRPFRSGVLFDYAKKNNALIIDFGPTIAVTNNMVVMLHDIRPMECKEYDSFKYRLLNYCIKYSIKWFKPYVVTVSNYQKERIISNFRYDPRKVKVIGSAWSHIKRISEDDSIFDELTDVRKGEFFYAIGSVAKHKNYRWIYEVAKRNPNSQFVVAGNVSLAGWGIDERDFIRDNILFTGYITDEKSKSLMKNCKAFLQPSKYEGFGLPPLEALSFGKKIIVSNTTSMPEIFEDTAIYIDPDCYDYNLDELVTHETGAPYRILDKYTWENEAIIWKEFIDEILTDSNRIGNDQK